MFFFQWILFSQTNQKDLKIKEQDRIIEHLNAQLLEGEFYIELRLIILILSTFIFIFNVYAYVFIPLSYFLYFFHFQS